MVVKPSSPNKEVLGKTRIILVDISPLFRQALRSYLEKQQDMEIIGEAGDGKEALELCTKLRPDVVIMDIDLPILDGLEATKQVVGKYPDTKVLILAAHGDDETILRTIKAGSSGYLMKRQSAEVIMHVVRVIAAGEKMFRHEVVDAININSIGKAKLLKNKSIKLTSKEEEILKLVANGLSNKEIAYNLGLSLPSIKASLSTIYTKLGASSRTEAMLLGLKSGILSVTDLMTI